MKVLVAEDTRDMNRVITVMLGHAGYAVDSAYDGAEALEMVLNSGYDALVLDIMMPKMDGLTVLRKLRERNINVPVLLLTAKAEVDDRVEGLNAGADDYLPKPFAMKELLARVNALTRRRIRYSTRKIECGDFRLDADSLELAASNSVRLSGREFELLQMFALNTDRMLEESYILEHVWPQDAAADGETLWLYVCYLKRKLKGVDSVMTIEGEKGSGYRLTGSAGAERAEG